MAEGEEDADLDEHGRRLRRPDSGSENSGFWGAVERGTRIAASIGVAGAAIIGVIEYIGSNEDVRRERSLEVVQDWQSGKMTDRFTRVQAFVEAQLETSTLPPASLPDELLAKAHENLGYNWMVDARASAGQSPPAIETDVDRLTLFFARMEICIEADLCNAEVLNAYFNSEATTFWQYFQGYARLRREANYADYGRPVNALVTRFQGMTSE